MQYNKDDCGRMRERESGRLITVPSSVISKNLCAQGLLASIKKTALGKGDKFCPK